jgi:hypothetical protein
VAKHFTDELWFDFARLVLPPEQMELMRRHLEEGCRQCGRLRDLWQAVVTTLNREREYEPAEASLRAAKLAYVDFARLYVLLNRAKMATLAFDSFFPSGAAAVRAGPHPPFLRHLLHRMGSWTVDLRLENLGGRRRSLIGQVLRSGRRRSDVGITAVMLVRDDKLLARTRPSAFGEFQMQFESEKNLKLYFDTPGRQFYCLVLPDSV